MRTRPLWHADDPVVRSIFRETLFLGREVPGQWPDLPAYESLCLGWYLGRGRMDSAVLEDDEERVVGYVLVCADPAPLRRWERRAGVRFFLRVGPGLVAGRYEGEAARFYRTRIQDGWELRRRSPALAPLGVVHMNLRPSARAGAGGRLLADHADRRVRAAGLPGWFGEINAPAGTRARALERLGGQVVHRGPNRTLTAATGVPVERLTVVRRFEADQAA